MSPRNGASRPLDEDDDEDAHEEDEKEEDAEMDEHLDQQALRAQQYENYYYNQSAFFTTEKINLPRGKVVKEDSLKSSPSHGFRQRESIGMMPSTSMKPRGSIEPTNLLSPGPLHMNMRDREGENLRSFSISRKIVPCPGNSLKPGAISPNKIRNKYQ